MSRKTHNERCRDCKKKFPHLLTALFGTVKVNWDLNLPCRLEDYRNTHGYGTLEVVHGALQKHRGFDQFVRAKKLDRVDYFIPSQNLIVELDESQHFTKPRDIALSLYPHNKEYGFSVGRWRAICQELNKRDNEPPFRDEQRAWYDTLRDFAPEIFGLGKTVRVYRRDLAWCALDPASASDLMTFEQTVMNKEGGG